VSLAETAIQKNPDYPDGRYNLGKAYERQGRLAEAAAQYREALRIDRGHVESRRALTELQARSAPASPAPKPSR
jgi:cytochrome c-type biogenesis protein CcmH/NrfG